MSIFFWKTRIFSLYNRFNNQFDSGRNVFKKSKGGWGVRVTLPPDLISPEMITASRQVCKRSQANKSLFTRHAIPVNEWTLCWINSPLSDVNVIVSSPGPGTTKSVALYWKKNHQSWGPVSAWCNAWFSNKTYVCTAQ